MGFIFKIVLLDVVLNDALNVVYQRVLHPLGLVYLLNWEQLILFSLLILVLELRGRCSANG